MNKLQQIYDAVEWSTSELRPSLVLLDPTWEELLLWAPTVSRREVGEKTFRLPAILQSTIISFGFDHENELNSAIAHINKDYERVLFLTSSFQENRVKEMKEFLVKSGAPECSIISTVSNGTASIHYQSQSQTSNFSQLDAFETICNYLEPAKTTIYHYPLHSLDLLPCSSNIEKKVELKILAANHFRRLSPLLLDTLGLAQNSEYQRYCVLSVFFSGLFTLTVMIVFMMSQQLIYLITLKEI